MTKKGVINLAGKKEWQKFMLHKIFLRMLVIAGLLNNPH